MRQQRGYAITTAAVGAGLALFALSRAWEKTGVPGAPPRSGAELLPWLPALALAALAGAGAVPATRGVARLLVGALLVACGLGVAAGAGYAITQGAPALWPGLAVLGGLATLEGGVVTLLRGRSWPVLGERYERHRAVVNGEAALWDALDRGEDPTRD